MNAINRKLIKQIFTGIKIFGTATNPCCPIFISWRLVTFRQGLPAFHTPMNDQLSNGKHNQHHHRQQYLLEKLDNIFGNQRFYAYWPWAKSIINLSIVHNMNYNTASQSVQTIPTLCKRRKCITKTNYKQNCKVIHDKISILMKSKILITILFTIQLIFPKTTQFSNSSLERTKTTKANQNKHIRSKKTPLSLSTVIEPNRSHIGRQIENG